MAMPMKSHISWRGAVWAHQRRGRLCRIHEPLQHRRVHGEGADHARQPGTARNVRPSASLSPHPVLWVTCGIGAALLGREGHPCSARQVLSRHAAERLKSFPICCACRHPASGTGSSCSSGWRRASCTPRWYASFLLPCHAECPPFPGVAASLPGWIQFPPPEEE